jgi:membrane-associated protein
LLHRPDEHLRRPLSHHLLRNRLGGNAFLPGDSLLFAIGAIGARDEIQLNVPVPHRAPYHRAVLGDAVNYFIGYKLGPAVFTKETGRLLNKKHLLKAQEFYEKYGGKTIILARFVPVIRTFAPSSPASAR